MQKSGTNKSLLTILLLGSCLIAGPALADKPDFAGGGQSRHASPHEQRESGGKHGKSDDHRGGKRERDPADDFRQERGPDSRRGAVYFQPEKRIVVRDYYHDQFRSGHCPPGLAKKRNGCQPPGQARKWQVGRPLPRDVIYYDLPDALVIQLGRPPASHRYVRIGADILMIAIGTGMVVDAIEDLGNM